MPDRCSFKFFLIICSKLLKAVFFYFSIVSIALCCILLFPSNAQEYLFLNILCSLTALSSVKHSLKPRRLQNGSKHQMISVSCERVFFKIKFNCSGQAKALFRTGFVNLWELIFHGTHPLKNELHGPRIHSRDICHITHR